MTGESLSAGDTALWDDPTTDDVPEEVTVTREYNGYDVLVERDDAAPIRVNPDQLEDTLTDALPASTVEGIGPAKAETLAEAGIETVGDVVAAGEAGLVDAGISEGWAEAYVERASALAGD